MGLKVIKNVVLNGLGVQISSNSLDESANDWYVPLLPERSDKLRPINPAELLEVQFENKRYFVPYMLLRTVSSRERKREEAGTLNNEDSIELLNIIRRRLAYDTAVANP